MFALIQAHDAVASGDARFVGISGPQGPRRSGLGGPRGDAAWVTRCGGACQAGEARALAAAARRKVVAGAE